MSLNSVQLFYVLSFTLFQLVLAQFYVDDVPDNRCITPKRLPGECISLGKCQHLFQTFKRGEATLPAQKQYLKNSICRMENNIPIICCDIDTGPCFTPDEQMGNCVPLERCNLLKNVFKSNPSRIDYREASKCDYNGIQKGERFCCPIFTNFIAGNILTEKKSDDTTQEIVTKGPSIDTSKFVLNALSLSSEAPPLINLIAGNDVVPAENRVQLPVPGEAVDQCGTHQITDKIINGDISDIYEFPWMALLRSGNGEFACGGSLISDRYVLTAAHCVKGEMVRKLNNITTVRLGEWDLSSEDDCVPRAGYEDCTTGVPVDIPVEEIMTHSEFKEITLENDIALIRLREKVNFTEFIKPMCLPLTPLNLGKNENFTVAGWGLTEAGTQSDKKLFLNNLFLADNSRCNMGNSIIGEGQLCIGSRISQGTCNGDSGGPLMAVRKIPGVSFVYYQIGIVSYATTVNCGQRPNVYTNVNNYLRWIRNNIRP